MNDTTEVWEVDGIKYHRQPVEIYSLTFCIEKIA